MAILYHFAIDYAPQFCLLGLPTVQVIWAQAIAYWAVALVLILLFGVNLQRDSLRKPIILPEKG